MNVLTTILTSRKFLYFIGSVIAQIAGRYGFDLDEGTLNNLLVLGGTLIGAQAVADHGNGSRVPGRD